MLMQLTGNCRQIARFSALSTAASPAARRPQTRHAMQQRKLKLPIPVTILTGSLGVGKTTALCRLVAQKPAGEVWCCIVNEFGAVGIDAAAIEGSAVQHGDVVVRQIAGGCMCCVLSGPLSAAVAQIIRQVKPDRVLIEPSGLGHPGGLIDILQGPNLRTALQLNAVLCLVDLTRFDPAAVMSNGITADQITVADILVGSKADAATPAAVEAFQQWAETELFPPKFEVFTIFHGELDKQWLEAPRTAVGGQLLLKPRRRKRQAVTQHMQRAAAGPQLDAAAALADEQAALNHDTDRSVSEKPSQGQPQRVLGQQIGQYTSCGWVFHTDDIFDQLLLMQLLQELQPLVARVKGVFRAGQKQWVTPSRIAREQRQQAQDQQQGVQQLQQPLQLIHLCYRGPSMVEVILEADSSNLDLVHKQLQQLLATLKREQARESSALLSNSDCCAGRADIEDAAACAIVSADAVWDAMQEGLTACLQLPV